MRLLSDLHENEVAKDIDGRRSLNSGAGVKKGDVSNKWWTLECKATMQADGILRVTTGLLLKTSREAKTRDKLPAISLAFIKGNLRVPKSLRVVVLVYLVPIDPPNPKNVDCIMDMGIGSLMADLTDPETLCYGEPLKFCTKGKTGVFQWWTLLDRRKGSSYLKMPKRSVSG